MKEKQLTLEEYIDFIKRLPSDGGHLKVYNNRKTIEVFYVIANKFEKTIFSLPEKTIYQVSGNNTDGFIVTLWRNDNE